LLKVWLKTSNCETSMTEFSCLDMTSYILCFRAKVCVRRLSKHTFTNVANLFGVDLAGVAIPFLSLDSNSKVPLQ